MTQRFHRLLEKWNKEHEQMSERIRGIQLVNDGETSESEELLTAEADVLKACINELRSTLHDSPENIAQALNEFVTGARCNFSPDGQHHYHVTNDRDGVACVLLVNGSMDHKFPREHIDSGYCLYCQMKEL